MSVSCSWPQVFRLRFRWPFSTKIAMFCYCRAKTLFYAFMMTSGFLKVCQPQLFKSSVKHSIIIFVFPIRMFLVIPQRMCQINRHRHLTIVWVLYHKMINLLSFPSFLYIEISGQICPASPIKRLCMSENGQICEDYTIKN